MLNASVSANVVIWPAQGSQPGFVLMTCRDESLVQAEQYSIENGIGRKIIYPGDLTIAVIDIYLFDRRYLIV